ncbi:hypothetical protein [Flavisolibacter ginsenosidimutans]|uniref:Transcription regulator BetR N-terminal domain-containing protein n=1 Tax=Flavisolibacter ginsenosidimutans TaxID=661481 RepID=A0A5B8ULB1_9BACT|nr:hypothetical protein [Flavisolibacter ginsenosidimutans]QEC57353.1 hypothetical protein FSB75_16075 [Flavisolibacter ginsenosidimutans]
MNTTDLQIQIFQRIKSSLVPAASLVDEIAGVLNISTDSAYRRIRGEKPVSVDEVYTLCHRYGLSLDALMNVKTDIIPFHGKYVDPAFFRFEDYLVAVAKQVGYMASFKEREMFYLCKDIPLFHHYQFKELAAFKYFFWHKTLLQSAGFASQKIALKNYPDEVYGLGRKAMDIYNSINSSEIWNTESLNGTLHQVEYFHDTRAFETDADLLRVYESLERLFAHIELQAELGYKFDSNDPGQKRLADFNMYFNEVVIGDNSIVGVLDGVKICFVTHTGINFMLTRDVDFCENMHRYYQNLMRKSTLISSVSERERSKFFKVLRNRIAVRKQNLRVSA